MFEPVPGCGKELVEAVRDAVCDIHYEQTGQPLPVHAKNISRLFREWEDRTCAQVVVKGVHVPYRYWGRLYREFAPASWKVLKQEFSEAKVRFFRTLSTCLFFSS
jgi:hypothetical protein